MIQIAICSPSPALRAGLRALAAADPDLAVAAVAATLDDLPPDLPLIDVLLASPEGAGLPDDPAHWPGGLAEKAAFGPGTALLLITGDPAQAQALRGLGLPAWGALTPEAPAEALLAALRALAEGLVVLSPELAASPAALAVARPGTGGAAAALSAIAAAGSDPHAPDEVLEALTARESEVLHGLAQGLTNKQIALALGISEHTVKFHVSSIYSKMGAANRTEAVRKGARRGWLPL